MKKYLDPNTKAFWLDEEGALHFDVGEALDEMGLPRTQENQDIAIRVFGEKIREWVPGARVEIRTHNPNRGMA